MQQIALIFFIFASISILKGLFSSLLNFITSYCVSKIYIFYFLLERMLLPILPEKKEFSKIKRKTIRWKDLSNQQDYTWGSNVRLLLYIFDCVKIYFLCSHVQVVHYETSTQSK